MYMYIFDQINESNRIIHDIYKTVTILSYMAQCMGAAIENKPEVM